VAGGAAVLLVILAALFGCAAAPNAARAQDATTGIGLSDSAPDVICVLDQLAGCPLPNVRHELFDRFQALSVDRTGGANSFEYTRAGVPWDAVSTGGRALGSSCVGEKQPPAFYGAPWIGLIEQYVLAARHAGLDPLIAITDNSAPRYPGNGNPHDPASPTANQYFCGFQAIVTTLDAFAARSGVAPPTEYETFDEPDGARVSNACNPTPIGDLPPHDAEQCAAWYYYEADAANRRLFGDRLTLVALAADGDSVNDPNLVAIKAYGRYLTRTVKLYPRVWSFHPYEDLSGAAFEHAGAHSGTSAASAYMASLYRGDRPQPAIWLTEAAAQLTDPVPVYFGAAAGCADGETDDPAPYTLGGCLDGNSRAQAYAASDFLSLARAGSTFPGQIERVYWHQFDSAAGHPTGWDSGLIAPGDRYERISYCVLSGESMSAALADPDCNRPAAAEDAEDSAAGYPEPDAVAARRVEALAGCPEPWCTFSLVRLRLSELAGSLTRRPWR
jgi:hypothetical protein